MRYPSEIREKDLLPQRQYRRNHEGKSMIIHYKSVTIMALSRRISVNSGVHSKNILKRNNAQLF